MKVRVLTSTLAGGTGTHLVQIMNLLACRGIDLEIFSEAPLNARVTPHVPVTVLPKTGRPAGYPWTQLRRLRALFAHFSDRRTEVTHSYFFWPIIYGRMLRARGMTRVLVENREDEGFDWGFHEYALLRATRRFPDAVICVSDAVADVVRSREGVGEGRVHVIHNGVETASGNGETDSARVLRRELGIPDDAAVVGMVANYDHRVKGAADFVRAIPLILDRCPSAYFVIVGEGRLRAEVEGLAAELGVDHRLRLPGFRRDVDRFYELMAVSVLTSLSEGFSITLLESMSRGLPVVVTRVGGNAEIVRDGISGFLVPPGHPSSFAERVSELLESPGLQERIGREARRIAQREFSLEATADRYAALYEELLSPVR